MEGASLKKKEVWIKVGVFFAFLSFGLGLLSVNIADPDLWGYMSFGRLFWQGDQFPYRDVFSYTPTLNPWVYHEWLTGVVLYPLYQALGAPGLQILKYGLGLATMGFIYLTARMRGAYPLPAVLLVAIILSSARLGYSPFRAQVFTYFFFAFSLYLLERARLTGRRRVLYLIPLLQIVWCNLHGGFVAGLGLIAIYAAGEFLSRRTWLPYLMIFLLSLLATMINPYGVTYWEYMVRAITMPRPNITEWASIVTAYQTGVANAALLLHLLVLCFVALWGMWQSKWREVTPSLALAVTLFLGIRHIRHLPFLWFLAAAYLPVCLNVNLDYLQSHPGLKNLWGKSSVKNVVLASLCLFIVLNSTFFIIRHPLSLKLPEKLTQQKNMPTIIYPVGAVNFIKEQGFSGKILTLFEWGEYLIWELYPQCLVAFDGRYETVYPPEVEEKYYEFHFARPGWRKFLEDYPPDLILLDKRMKVIEPLSKDPQWRQVYTDASCVLFMPDKKSR